MTKVGGPGGANIPQQSQDTGQAQQASEQDAGKFRQAVDKNKPKTEQRKDQGRDKADDGKKSSSRGDSMLKSLQSQSEGKELPAGMQAQPNPAIMGKGGEGGAKAGMTDAAGRAESLSDIAKSVADSIKVGAKGTAGEGEVRIQLKDSVLGGAEVRVKQEGGRFEITFVTKTADAQNFLTSRMGEFRGELGNRLEREVNINVETQDDMDQHDQRDRRSRQQYVAEDDDEG